MYKFAFAAFAAALTVSASAVEINVSSTPVLPAANLLKNGSFEDGKTAPWRLNGGNSALDTENKFSGNAAIKITGDPAKRPNVAQSFPVSNIKAGDPLYVRFAAKNSGCDIDKNPAAIAWQAVLANGKRPYLPTLSLPREDYDWTTFEHVIKAPGDIKSLTFYFCYYNQEGSQFFDDAVIQGGTTDLKIDVKGNDLKNIKVRHSVTGTVLNEVIKGNAFSKTIKVPYFGSYAVEVTDSKGVRTSKLYPGNVDANRSGENITPLVACKRINLASAKPESLSFELPAAAKGKKVFLEFSARCNQLNPVAGYTAMLKVSVNGKVCRAAELVKPMNRSKTASGGEMIFARNNGYVVYYSNACYGISEDSTYCPVSLVDRNPFNFKLNVTKLVKEGMNTLKLENVLPPRMKREVYVDNLVLVTE